MKCTAFNFTSIRKFRIGLLLYAVKPNLGLLSTVLLPKSEEPESMGWLWDARRGSRRAGALAPALTCTFDGGGGTLG